MSDLTLQQDLQGLKSLKNERNAAIDAASTRPLPKTFPVNELASKLHPESQFLKIKQVIEHSADERSFVLEPDTEKGTQHLAYFRAGQYISFRLKIGNSYVTRPYAIRSAPADALKDQYIITIKRVKNGFVTSFIFANWDVGTPIEASAPAGNLYFEPLRDQKNIVGLAGGSGITPFYSLASAIADGTEHVKLTILYGSRQHDHILLAPEFSKILSKTNDVKLINVLSDDDIDGFEHGFITAELIQKYAPKTPYSIFICGPEAMYEFMDKEVKKLNLPAGRIRHELSGNYGSPYHETDYPADSRDKVYQLTVKTRDHEQIISAQSNESILVAMERAGITAPSLCRSGECGVCRSRLISGKVFSPEIIDGRRVADSEYGYIHTCASFPISDVSIEVPVHDLADQFG